MPLQGFDPNYFDETVDWEDRLHNARPANASPFWDANVRALRQRIDAGSLAAVVNIEARWLLKLLRGDRYKNAYILAAEQQSPHYVVVGGVPGAHVERLRLLVDHAFNLAPPADFFFAAASWEGTGVRAYGHYCMVLAEQPSAGTQIVDRDSYEAAFPPFRGGNRRLRDIAADVARALRGTWGRDLVAIAALKMRPLMARDERLTSSALHAQALLEGEEFIEVHLCLPATASAQPGFDRSDLREVRQDAGDIAEAERIDAGFEHGVSPRMENLIFSLRRRAVERALSDCNIATRVVREGRL